MRLATVLAALLASSCCLGSGSGCDPSTYEAHCDGDGFTFCMGSGPVGFDIGGHEQHTACGAGDTCITLGVDAVACVASPPTRCDLATYVGRCDHGGALVCTSPSSFVTDTYVVHGSGCPYGTTCVDTPIGPDCAATP
jgi:hypothetical protein